jgi:hypothetical protein
MTTLTPSSFNTPALAFSSRGTPAPTDAALAAKQAVSGELEWHAWGVHGAGGQAVYDRQVAELRAAFNELIAPAS